MGARHRRVVAGSYPALGKVGAYAAAKAAEEALVLTVGEEAKDRGVTANVLQVRTIDTAHRRDRQPSPANASWTTPEEFTAAILYLCSDAADTVNGARLPLFGPGG
jgi:NAD(P)-dependent dehydrogenase (short-subunit alcohol dehydrogenase family)